MSKPADLIEWARLPAAPDLAGAVVAWLRRLGGERQMSAHTIEAYGRDARQFLAFLAERFGAPPSVEDFANCAPADVRAFLARRRAAGIEGRSLQRALSALRSLGKHIAREGGDAASALGAIRAPKASRRLPRPLPADDATAVTTTAPREGEAREPWVLARDAAVLALCYGAGLRISEALGIRRADAPVGAVESITVVGKGKKARSAPMRSNPTARCSLARRAVPCRRASCNWRWSACAALSGCRIPPRRTRFVIPSPRTFWRAAATSGPSRICSATPRYPRPKSIRASTARGCWPPTAPLI